MLRVSLDLEVNQKNLRSCRKYQISVKRTNLAGQTNEIFMVTYSNQAGTEFWAFQLDSHRFSHIQILTFQGTALFLFHSAGQIKFLC